MRFTVVSENDAVFPRRRYGSGAAQTAMYVPQVHRVTDDRIWPRHSLLARAAGVPAGGQGTAPKGLIGA